MAKWVFSLVKTEDDRLAMFFFGKNPAGTIIKLFKMIVTVGTFIAKVKQYFN